MRLLLIEDDCDLSSRLVARLAPHGLIIEHVVSAEQALTRPDLATFSCLIVDIGLDGVSGVDFIRHLRDTGHAVPILVLTARGSWQEKVEGLNAGADDYVVKPVRAEELVARLQALMRRAAGQTHARLSAGGLELDQQAKTAWLDGRQIDLTQTEFRLLQLFLHRAGHVLAHAEILDHLYPMSKEREHNTLEVHIGRLRRKIGKDVIRTIRGLGYRLVQ
jgi:two-component system OmpR family response regulator